ncbi:MAG TPA: Cache 3/Cache 2 fusion domain-containing protein, partial [Tepidisphaeraceae bacterium]|nr:Cache 3/Cache 2 fusion domain-containing protein [Tepidisphaeraceae bacterium]
GSNSPVIAAMLRGERFVGRAFVVDGWYATAYEPIRDGNGDVIGMLFFGLPEAQATESLRRMIMDIPVGKTGYIYVLNAKGSTRGHYVISHQGKRDGENILEAKDARGRSFIREICDQAVTLSPETIGRYDYPWLNPGDSVAREKIAKIAYFAPWDWVIGVGSYHEEFLEAANTVHALGRRGQMTQMTIAGICIGMTLLVWFIFSGRLARRIMETVVQLTNGAEQVASASNQVSSASQSLAQDVTEQAASLQESSASLSQMSSMTSRSAESAAEATRLAAEARTAATRGNEVIGQMSAAIDQIQQSANETARILKVIDEIAFQTNLLAGGPFVYLGHGGAEHGDADREIRFQRAQRGDDVAGGRAGARGDQNRQREGQRGRGRDRAGRPGAGAGDPAGQHRGHPTGHGHPVQRRRRRRIRGGE